MLSIPFVAGLFAVSSFWLGQVNSLTISKRGTCPATNTAAEALASRIQSHYFNIVTGEYSELWTDANTLEDIHTLMLAAGVTTWDSLAGESYIGRVANTGIPSWSTVLDGSYDDAQWIILSLWKIADYQTSQGKSATNYLNAANTIYDIVSAQWDDTTCNGGVWWSSDKNYKNSITNHLYLYTSAEGFNRNSNQTYLDNAEKTWTWLEASGLRNSQGLWNDGLDMTSCANNGQTTWTYNQGVIASGLGALSKANGNTSLPVQAEITLDAAISLLTQDNILKESCDDVTSGGSSCNADQQIFKGVWAKHLAYYLDAVNSATSEAKYSPFLGSLNSAVTHYGVDADGDCSSTWYAANAGGGTYTAQSDASGLAAFNAASKYGPC
ncbi:glycoside hydrolase family 76 protein [Athelia psychrophila]|uniref:Glycoside hydrolase family 76 protein n=1 Tax=Athelia psychrophila TaxID=1759441 RepID=A0A166PVD8_9AGAM|nr:glycoside hydrolase family 76 protein [Fibularhizoctonia sp. CBS 109695]